MRFSKHVVLYLGALMCGWGQFLPKITLTPATVPADSGDLRLTVSGKNFTRNLQVRWNGQPLGTEFVDVRTMKTTVPGDAIAKPGLAQILLYDTSQGAAASDPVPFLTYLPLQHRDLVYDPLRARIYVSVASADVDGPSIAVIDPASGRVDRFIPLLGDPGALAISDDSHYLYVGLGNNLANSVYKQRGVRRIDLTGGAANLDIPPNELFGIVVTMAALPGRSSSVVVGWGVAAGQTSRITVYDDSIPRPQSEAFAPGNCLFGRPEGATMYAVSGGPRSLFYVLKIDANGVEATGSGIPGFLMSAACPSYAGGLLYGGSGDIVDPEGPAVAGRLDAAGLTSPAPESNKVYVFGGDPGSILANILVFDIHTQRLLQLVPLPTSQPDQDNGRLIHWGQDGVAFGEYDPFDGGLRFKRLYIFQLPRNP